MRFISTIVTVSVSAVGIISASAASGGPRGRQTQRQRHTAAFLEQRKVVGGGSTHDPTALGTRCRGESCSERHSRRERRCTTRSASSVAVVKSARGGAGGWGQHRRSPACTSSSMANLSVRGGRSQASSEKIASGKESAQLAYRSALLRTGLLLTSAGAFGLGTMAIKGKKASLEFFTGYIVEQSLSIDNLFIFIMLFDYFKVPEEFQSRVLQWGIIGAMAMRAVMITVGVAAIQRFRWVMLFFAGILVVSSLNLLMEKEDDHGDSSKLENNMVLKFTNWIVDSVDYYDGENFFTMVNGVKKATPLLLCLICIELTDFVFAVDSIPAVLGISQDTFIIYASNVFAICAMRSIYTLVSHAITDMPYLKPAVALVLGFVGAKMCAEFFHYKVDVGISLLVVASILAVGAIASIVSNRKRDSLASESLSGGGSEGLTFKSIAVDEAGHSERALLSTIQQGTTPLEAFPGELEAGTVAGHDGRDDEANAERNMSVRDEGEGG